MCILVKIADGCGDRLLVFKPWVAVNLNEEYKPLKLFKDTESTYAQPSRQNQRLVHLVSMILTVSVFFLALHQIAIAQTVHIPDPNLRAALGSALGKEVGTDISQAEMESLESLDAFEAGIRDLTGLEFAVNLAAVYLGLNEIGDVSPLKNLTKLTVLDLHRNGKISDVSPLKGLTNLIWLSLRGNRISDVSPLKDLINLIYLHLGYNQILDVSPLKTLAKLTFLNLDANRISDVSPLSVLINLINIALDDNRISDVSPLSVLINLKFLNLNDNQILDVSPLSVLINLKFLDLHGNEISDVSPLKDLVNLTNLKLQENQISDVSPLKDLVNLTVLDLHDNHILDFSPIAGLIENLIEYDASNQTVPMPKAADVNRDGVVNIMDLVVIASNFHEPDLAVLAQLNTYPDVNRDDVVNLIDLLLVAVEMGSDAAAPALSKSSVETSNLTAENLSQWIRLAKQLDTHDPQMQKGITVLEQLLAALSVAEMLPKETALLANYPNPFNPETWIPYQLSEPADVRISIHSADGKLIRVLELGQLSAGRYYSKSRAVYWDGRNELGESVASGIYFYTLTTDDFTATGKMLIQK